MVRFARVIERITFIWCICLPSTAGARKSACPVVESLELAPWIAQASIPDIDRRWATFHEQQDRACVFSSSPAAARSELVNPSRPERSASTRPSCGSEMATVHSVRVCDNKTWHSLLGRLDRYLIS